MLPTSGDKFNVQLKLNCCDRSRISYNPVYIVVVLMVKLKWNS